MPEMLALVVREGDERRVTCHTVLLQNVTLFSLVFWSYYTFGFPPSFILWLSANWARAGGGLLYYAWYGLVSPGEAGQGCR